MSSITILDSQLLECYLHSVISNRTWFIIMVHLTARAADSAEAMLWTWGPDDYTQSTDIWRDPPNW